MHRIVKEVATAQASDRVRSLSCRDVEDVRHLVDGLVLSPVDRNTKDRLIQCPALYWQGVLEDSFRERTPGVDAETEEAVLQR